MSFKIGEVACGDVLHSIFWVVAQPELCLSARKKYFYQNIGKKVLALILNKSKSLAYNGAGPSHKPLLSQLNLVSPGAGIKGKELGLDSSDFKPVSSPSWRMMNSTMKLIASQGDMIINDIRNYVPEDMSTRLDTEFLNMVENYSFFVASCSGTKGTLRMKDPISVGYTRIQEIHEQSSREEATQNFSQMFEAELAEMIATGEPYAWVQEQIRTQLYPCITFGDYAQVMIDIGFSIFLEDKRLFFLADPTIAKVHVDSMLKKTKADFLHHNQAQQPEEYDPEEDDDPAEEEEQEQVTYEQHEQSLDPDDMIQTLQDGMIHVNDYFGNDTDYNSHQDGVVGGEANVATNSTESDDGDDSSDYREDEDDDLFETTTESHNGSDEQEEEEQGNSNPNQTGFELPIQWTNMIPYWDRSDNIPAGPSNSQQVASYYNRLSARIMRTRSNLFKYNFGQRFGNTHTGQPSLFIIRANTPGVSNYATRGRTVLFPPPGPCGAQTYLSGDKNNNYALRHNIRPEILSGFGSTTELLLKDNLYLSGERLQLEKDWLKMSAIVEDQCEYEKAMFEATERRNVATAESNLVFRVEVFCVTQQRGAIRTVPFPQGVMQALHIESIVRYQKWRSKILSNEWNNLRKLREMIHQCQSSRTRLSPCPYLGASEYTRNRIVGSAGLLEQSLNMLTPPNKQVQRLFLSSGKIRMFLNARWSKVVSNEEKQKFGIQHGCSPRPISRFRRDNIKDLDVLKEFSIYERFKTFREIKVGDRNSPEVERARNLRLKYKLLAPELNRRRVLSKSKEFRCSTGMDYLFAIIISEQMSGLLQDCFANKDPSTIEERRARQLLVDCLQMVREAYFYDYSILYKNLIRKTNQLDYDPVAKDFLKDFRSCGNLEKCVMEYGLFFQKGRVNKIGVGFLNARSGLVDVLKMTNAGRVSKRDVAFRNAGKFGVLFLHISKAFTSELMVLHHL